MYKKENKTCTESAHSWQLSFTSRQCEMRCTLTHYGLNWQISPHRMKQLLPRRHEVGGNENSEVRLTRLRRTSHIFVFCPKFYASAECLLKVLCSKAAGIYFHKYPPAVDIEVDLKTKRKKWVRLSLQSTDLVLSNHPCEFLSICSPWRWCYDCSSFLLSS